MFFCSFRFRRLVGPTRRARSRRPDAQKHVLDRCADEFDKNRQQKAGFAPSGVFCGGFSPVGTCAIGRPLYVCPSSPDLAAVVFQRKLCADAISLLNFCNYAAGKQLCRSCPAPWVAQDIQKYSHQLDFACSVPHTAWSVKLLSLPPHFHGPEVLRFIRVNSHVSG